MCALTKFYLGEISGSHSGEYEDDLYSRMLCRELSK
jgi:hypothetical protein